MKINTKTRYGTRLMLELARHYQEGPLQLNEIARMQELPLKYLEQIVILLKGAGLIKSVRGAKGGHMLARPPEEISVWDIMEVTEDTDLTPCSERELKCDRYPKCETKDVWIKIRKLLQKELENITLAQLLRGPNGIEKKEEIQNV